jgi:NAD(P)H-nitrite reductase large subunit
VPIIKITCGQRIALVGIQEIDLESVCADLGHDAGYTSGLCLHYVQACPGTKTFRFGNKDAPSLARRIKTAVAGKVLPAKLKAGVSGCPQCCGKGHTEDIGVMGASWDGRLSLVATPEHARGMARWSHGTFEVEKSLTLAHAAWNITSATQDQGSGPAPIP